MVFRDGAIHFWQYVSETLLTHKQLTESVAHCHSLCFCGPTLTLHASVSRSRWAIRALPIYLTCRRRFPSFLVSLSENNRGGKTQPQAP